ncbi:hypothetical protein WA026_021585 [Henosepilachna vigintioctopunctata]|uniref:Uncharacterized protein n=1 Tax=Henosepilachna vigintioctopunctata TaxID=420089 RepID=A0AAW1UUX0_9CUCU
MLRICSILLVSSLIGVKAVEFQIKNNLGGEIWVGILGNPGKEQLRNGGFKLAKGVQESVNAPDGWAGRVWARTYCDQGTNHCQTGDCGNKLECNGAGGNPPATLAEIRLQGNAGLDFYDVSLVDGFNVQCTANLFYDQWIANNRPHLWPPHSPDFSVLDYFIWGTVKSKVFNTAVTTVEDCMRCVTTAFEELISQSIRRAVYEQFLLRYEKCLEVKGINLNIH